jgi:hypothetical protein
MPPYKPRGRGGGGGGGASRGSFRGRGGGGRGGARGGKGDKVVLTTEAEGTRDGDRLEDAKVRTVPSGVHGTRDARRTELTLVLCA